MLGNLVAPAVYPRCVDGNGPTVREELFKDARGGATFSGKKPDRDTAKLVEEAAAQVAQWSVEVTYLLTPERKLLVAVAGEIVNPALRFGALIADSPRSVGNLKRSSTNDATSSHSPISIPPRDHVAQLCDPFRSGGETRPLALPEADRADA